VAVILVTVNGKNSDVLKTTLNLFFDEVAVSDVTVNGTVVGWVKLSFISVFR
jgi:hypothetical protein